MYIYSLEDLGNKSLEGRRPQTYFYKFLHEAEESLEMSQALTDMISISGFQLKSVHVKVTEKRLPVPYSAGRRGGTQRFTVCFYRMTCWFFKRQSSDWILWFLGAFLRSRLQI